MPAGSSPNCRARPGIMGRRHGGRGRCTAGLQGPPMSGRSAQALGEGVPGAWKPIPLSEAQGLSSADAGATPRPRPPRRLSFSWPLPTPVCNRIPAAQDVRLSACFSPNALGGSSLRTGIEERSLFPGSAAPQALPPDLTSALALLRLGHVQHLLCASSTPPASAHLCSGEVDRAFIYFYYRF